MSLNPILKTIWIISFIILIYLAAADLVINSDLFYRYEFDKNNIYSQLPSAYELKSQILDFFDHNTDLSDSFPKKEKQHMTDVRNLIDKAKILWNVLALINLTFFSLILLLDKSKNRFRFLILNGIIFLIIPLILFFINFSDLFIKFHYIFFPNGNWAFPESSILITLFPESFFFHASILILSQTIIIGIFCIFLGIFSSRFGSNTRISFTT
jgi:integral membrane protein (TIGR01906 family)